MFYVYFLISPVDEKVFYIGKGKDKRMYRHVSLAKKNKMSNGNEYLYRKIKSILENHSDVNYQIVFETENEKEAYDKEQELIIEYGLENLCNLSIGYNLMTEEIKQKISESVKNLYRNNEDYKNKLLEIYESEDYRTSQSIALKNSEKHKEKMYSPEIKKLISDKLKEHYNKKYGEYKNLKVSCYVCQSDISIYVREFLIPEKNYCSKNCIYSIRKSESYKTAMSISVKNSEKHKAIYTEEFRKNISESTKKWWSSLNEEELIEYKEKMSNSLKNSYKHKEKMSSEEYKRNLSLSLKSSKDFKAYNENRKGKSRGKYKESEKNKERRKKSILIDAQNNIIKEFCGLNEVSEYFNIKISTACIWIKKGKEIGDLKLIKVD